MSNRITTSPMKDLQGYMEPEQIQKLIEHAHNKRDKVLFTLLYVTGARISEVVGDKSWYQDRVFYGLHVEDILWKESVVLLDTLKRRKYPPDKRRVAIDSKTLAMLNEYVTENHLDPKAKVFNITRQRVEQIIREVGQSIGLKKIGKKKIHPHHLRHSSAVKFIRKLNTLEGLRKLQQRLGHADINTTAHYLQFAPQSQKEVEEIYGN